MSRDFRNPITEVAAAINNSSDGGALDSSLAGTKMTYSEEQQKIKDEFAPPQNTTQDSAVPGMISNYGPGTEAGVDRTSGFSRQVNNDPTAFIPSLHSPKARPATAFDLAKLDESNIMDIPFIEAKSLDIPAMLQIKPKEANIRFRWVNFKNNEGGNYGMFKAIGFTNATPDDVDGEIGEHLRKEDGTIKWWDVILMKVNVITLMSAYKKNIQRSLHQVGRWDKGALEEAKKTFANSCSADALQALKQAGLNVEFYVPNKAEMESQDKGLFADLSNKR